MKTHEDIVRQAYEVRQKYLRDGKDPREQHFVVTAEDYRTLEQNWVGAHSGRKPERICGMRLKII